MCTVFGAVSFYVAAETFLERVVSWLGKASVWYVWNLIFFGGVGGLAAASVIFIVYFIILTSIECSYTDNDTENCFSFAVFHP